MAALALTIGRWLWVVWVTAVEIGSLGRSWCVDGLGEVGLWPNVGMGRRRRAGGDACDDRRAVLFARGASRCPGVWSSDRARSVRVNARSLSKAEASEVEAVAWLVDLASDACGEEVAERADAPSDSWRVVSGEVGVEPCVGL